MDDDERQISDDATPRTSDAAREVFDDVKDTIWWLVDDDIVHEPLMETVRMVVNQASWRMTEYARYYRLYNGSPMSSTPWAWTMYTASSHPDRRMAFNVVRNCIATLHAKIGKNKPKATFLTMDGNFTQKRRAKMLEKFVDGAMMGCGAYTVGAKALRDALIFGTGAVKVLSEDDDTAVRIEHLMPGSYFVDETDGTDGEPRAIYQVYYVDRAVLADMFPEHVDEIRNASPTFSGLERAGLKMDRVPVFEAWHLRSGPNAKDGRHAIAIEGTTLLAEEWNRKRFPIVTIHYVEPVVGFFGDGLAEEMMGAQIQLNRMDQDIAQAQHLVARPRVLVEAGSKVARGSVTSEIGTRVDYSGTPPQFITPAAMPPEVYSHFDRIYQRSFETVGISQLSASATIPRGLSGASGKALDTYNDIETERFVMFGKAYEQFYIDIAWRMIDEARELASRTENFTVRFRGSKWLRTIAWKDVELDDDAFDMGVFPTSAFANSPAARLAQIQQLITAGMIDHRAGMRLLDFPDLQRDQTLADAAYDAAEKAVEDILYHDRDDVLPEPFDDLVTCATVSQAQYLVARNDNAPEDRLEALRRYNEACREGLRQLAEALPPAANENGQVQGMQPAGNPMQTGAPPVGGVQTGTEAALDGMAVDGGQAQAPTGASAA